jgi:hypothetical protein
VVVGFQVAIVAAFDAHAAFTYDEPAPLNDSQATLPGWGITPLAQRQLALASATGYRAALAGLMPWRVITSLALAAAAGLVFFMGMRLRVSPEGRPAVAENLGRAALGAAILRSIDGAENLVIVRTTLEEVSKAMVREGVPDAHSASVVGTFLASAASGAWTLVMVATFVVLGNYFRSETLRTALGRAER